LAEHQISCNRSPGKQQLYLKFAAPQTTDIGNAERYDQVISLANMVKTVVDELQGINPFNILKHSFWYLIGIGVLLLICFYTFSVGC
jgi:hypothetical protein